MDITKSKKRKNKQIISFDEEIVTKDSAEKILLNEVIPTLTKGSNLSNNSKENNKKNTIDLKHKKSKRKKVIEDIEVNAPQSNANDDGDSKIKIKVKKGKSPKQVPEKTETENDDEISLEKPEIKQKESIRAQKRKKHEKLLEDKRLKAEINSQQNALTYLSLWKHNRTEWRFEKLKQIWLQQNLFEPSKIPNEFWNTVVEYFCGAKGAIRTNILKCALNIIEKDDNSEDHDTDENSVIILQRARDIVQNLQE